MFEDGELLEQWGKATGDNNKKRLEWLLKITSTNPILPVNFKIYFGDDSGFTEEFRDSQFYPRWGMLSKDSNQVGHFLSAVNITYYHWDQAAIVGHEQYPDGALTNLFSYLWVSGDDMKRWFGAIKLDETEDFQRRDQELWPLLHFSCDIKFGDIDETRPGNSLQDLRLSLKGVRFVRWVNNNKQSAPINAGTWLRSNLE
jgi:hypothetical protein